MESDIIINIKNINPFNLQMNLKGFYLNHKNIKYFISCNHGFSIEKIIINNKSYKRFTNCLWNEILFLKNFKCKNEYVFNNFLVKHIDSIKKFKVNNCTIQYTSTEYFPIAMLPSNPKNIYYKMKILDGKIKKGDSGSPVYLDSKRKKSLIGVVSKIEDDYVYVIPIIYVIKSLNKIDNKTIYTLNDLEKITYIKNKKIYENKMIYDNSFGKYIPLCCYINLYSDKNQSINVKMNNKCFMTLKFSKLETKIKNSYLYMIKKNNITLTSSFLRYLKEVNFRELLNNISKIFNNESCKIILNDIEYIITF